jgi:dihydroxyacid dehydratase/phosphogluconate dehydratase
MLAFGQSDDWSALSNLLSDRSRQEDHTKRVREAIAAQTDGAISVFVSHGVSISAFVNVYLQQGEMVVVRHAGATGDGGIEVVGRLLIP